jgi:hypothetical protein
MDERYQQQSPGPAVYPPQQYAPQPPAGYQPVATRPPSRANIFVRMLRLLLRRLFYGLTLLGRRLAPHKLAIGIALPLLALVVALAGYLVWERISPSSPSFARADSIPPGGNVETYLNAQRKYDVDQMWDSFSPSLQASLLDQGRTKNTMRAQFQNQKLAGLSYLKSSYIGGVKLTKGGALYFYVVDVRLPQGAGNEKAPFTFTVDEEGKITGVSTQQQQ